MFLVTLKYIKPIEVVDQHVADHRNFLDQFYKKDCFIVSGPMNPRVGGVILSQLTDRDQLMAIIHQDPYYIHDVAEYEVIEFTPVKYHVEFASFIND